MKSLPVLVALVAIGATSVAVTARTVPSGNIPAQELQKSLKIEPVDISIDDLALPIKSRKEFQESLIQENVLKLNGKRVRMIGQMYMPVVPREVKEFVFNGDTERETGPFLLDRSTAPLEQLIKVSLKQETKANSTSAVIQVEGRLSIEVERSNGEIQFLYRIEDATIRPAVREDGFRPSLISLPIYTC
jgi:hypothetical protein